MKAELRKNKSFDGVQKLIGRNGYYQTHVEDILREVKLGEWCRPHQRITEDCCPSPRRLPGDGQSYKYLIINSFFKGSIRNPVLYSREY